MKIFWIAFITVVVFVDCFGLNLRTEGKDQQLTDAELQATRQLALEFTRDFVKTTDLAPLIRDRFAKDFIQRYTKSQLKNASDYSARRLLFAPGLEYDTRLLSEASPEDWLKFYTATQNFMLLGTMAAIKNSRSAEDIKALNMFPKNVISLLNTNPNLSNMIVRKERPKPVGSVAEMQKATAILEQAVALMRQNKQGLPTGNINEQELMKEMQEREFFTPKVQTIDDNFFGLPKGTQVVVINTPILFRLMLVKADNNRWEILWADPATGG